MKNIKYILPIYFMIISGHISAVHADGDTNSVQNEKMAAVKQKIFPILIENLGGIYKPGATLDALVEAFDALNKEQQKAFLSTYGSEIKAPFKSIIGEKIDFRLEQIFEGLKSGVDTKTADRKTADTKTADTKTADTKTADTKTDDTKTVQLMRDILSIPKAPEGQQVPQDSVMSFITIAITESTEPGGNFDETFNHFLSLDKEKQSYFIRKAKKNMSLKIHPDKVSKNNEKLAIQAFDRLTELSKGTEEFLQTH
jgi:hypothetical protein